METKVKESDDIFKSDIEEMMFGFGDSWPPNKESVDLVETLVVQYIEDLAVRASEIAQIRGQLDKECFMFLVRKDRQKFTRVVKLLDANDEIKRAQKVLLEEDSAV